MSAYDIPSYAYDLPLYIVSGRHVNEKTSQVSRIYRWYLSPSVVRAGYIPKRDSYVLALTKRHDKPVRVKVVSVERQPAPMNCGRFLEIRNLVPDLVPNNPVVLVFPTKDQKRKKRGAAGRRPSGRRYGQGSRTKEMSRHDPRVTGPQKLRYR